MVGGAVAQQSKAEGVVPCLNVLGAICKVTACSLGSIVPMIGPWGVLCIATCCLVQWSSC